MQMVIVSNRADKEKETSNHRVDCPNRNDMPENVASTSSSNDLPPSLFMKIDDPSINDSSANKSKPRTERSTEKEKNVSHSSILGKTSPSNLSEKQDEKVKSSVMFEATTSKQDRVDRASRKKSKVQKISPISEEPVSKIKAAAAEKKKKEQILQRTSHSEDSSSYDEEEPIARHQKPLEKSDGKETGEKSVKDEPSDFLVTPLNLEEFRLHGERRTSVNEAELAARGSPERSLVEANDNGVVQWIKYEPDLTIVDDDESIYNDSKSISSNMPAPTPLKLKHVKQEIRTRYSEIDVVTVSDGDEDDDDDYFPASQLFGDELEDRVKIESFKSEQEEEEENENEGFGDERIDDPDIIFLIDSEDEEDPLYNRVMQSSLNESRDLFVKRREPADKPDEQFDKLDDVQEEIYNLCFAEEQDETDEIISNKENSEIRKKRSSSMEKLESTRMDLLEELKHLASTHSPSRLENASKSGEKLHTLKQSSKPTDEAPPKKASLQDEKEDSRRRRSTEKKRVDKKLGSKEKEKIEENGTIEESVAVETKGKKHCKHPTSIDGKSSKMSDSTEQAKLRRIPREESPARSGASSKCHSKKHVKQQSLEKLLSTDEPETRKKSGKISNDRSRLSNASETSETSRNISNEERRSRSPDRSRSSSSAERSVPMSKQVARSTTLESPVGAASKNAPTRKSVPLVDPPFLSKGERRGVSCGIKKKSGWIDSDEASTSSIQQSPQTSVHDDSSSTKEESSNASWKKSTPSKCVPELTTKQKKELALLEKQAKYVRMKEQKARRQNHKWAECLPPRTHQGPSLTRQERQDIKNDRKEKLKKIANEKKRASGNNESFGTKRPVKKGIAKVTEKTRGDFLVNPDDQVAQQSSDPESTFCLKDAESSEQSNDKHCNKSTGSTSKNLVKDPHTREINGAKSSEERNRKYKSLNVMSENLTNGETSIKNCEKSSKTMKSKHLSMDMENVNPANGKNKQISRPRIKTRQIIHSLYNFLLCV